MNAHLPDESELTLEAGGRSLSLTGPMLGLLGVASMLLLGTTVFLFLDHLRLSTTHLGTCKECPDQCGAPINNNQKGNL